MKIGAFLEVSTTIPCVLNCVYCPQSLLKTKYTSEKKELSLAEFKIIVDKLPKNSTVCFAGFSEPFANQSCVDMILYAYEKGYIIWVLTTLFGLSIEQYKRIKHIEYGNFVLHLPDNQNKTPVPISKRYLETLEFIVNNPPNPKISFLHHRGDVHNQIRHLVPYSKETTIVDRAGNLHLDEDHIVSVIHKLGNLKCTNSFLTNYENGSGVVLPNGDVYLCCNDFGLSHKLGNLLYHTWSDVINSNEMKKILDGLYDEECNILCKRCSAAKPY